MRKVFTVLSTLLMVAVLVQFFLAAANAFDSAPNDEAFQPHRALGYAILAFAVVLTIVAAVARLPGRLIGLTGLVAGLVVAQALIATIAKAFGDTAGALVFGLHAINGLVIFGLAESITRQAKEPVLAS
jgi:hypothetical protein